MKILEYQIKFSTPAFLGNAEQAGQWRTPPIKALLRQWWRVAYAADRGFNVEPAAMRYAEGLLFGHAWLNDDHDTQGRPVTARKSQVQIRLDNLGLGGYGCVGSRFANRRGSLAERPIDQLCVVRPGESWRRTIGPERHQA